MKKNIIKITLIVLMSFCLCNGVVFAKATCEEYTKDDCPVLPQVAGDGSACTLGYYGNEWQCKKADKSKGCSSYNADECPAYATNGEKCNKQYVGGSMACVKVEKKYCNQNDANSCPAVDDYGNKCGVRYNGSVRECAAPEKKSCASATKKSECPSIDDYGNKCEWGVEDGKTAATCHIYKAPQPNPSGSTGSGGSSGNSGGSGNTGTPTGGASGNVGDGFCQEVDVIRAIRTVGYFIFIAKILVPFIIIFVGTLDLAKAVQGGDADALKKNSKQLGIRIVIGLLVFFGPAIIHVIFSMVSEYSKNFNEILTCETCLLKPFSCKNDTVSPDGSLYDGDYTSKNENYPTNGWADTSSNPVEEQFTDISSNPVENQFSDESSYPVENQFSDTSSNPVEDIFADESSNPVEDIFTDVSSNPVESQISSQSSQMPESQWSSGQSSQSN